MKRFPAHYVLALAVSGTWGKADWQSWSDGIMDRGEGLPSWVLEVSLASDVDALWLGLSEALGGELAQQQETVPFGDLLIAMYFRRLVAGDLPLGAFLRLSGVEAESGACSVAPEYFYAMLHGLESGVPVAVEALASVLGEALALLEGQAAAFGAMFAGPHAGVS